MNVAADHAVDAAAVRFGGERALIFPDEIDCVLHFQLRPLRQRPVGQPEAPADGIANVAANMSDFGSHNLDDLLARLPPETMAPGYAWEYRDSLTRRRRR